MDILVIGGTGFIGSNLVRYLLSIGERIKVFHRNNSSLGNLKGLNYTSIIGDICDEKSLSYAIEDCKGVFNLAVCSSTLKKDHALRQLINVEAAGKIARVVRKMGRARLVHVSSIAAIGVPEHGEIADEKFKFNRYQDHYSYTKHLGEEEVLKEAEHGLDAVIACPGNVVGYHGMKEMQLNNFRSIAKGKMKFYPAGGVCIADVDDVVRGVFLCFTNGRTGKRYILGGHNVSYKEYLNAIAYASGGIAPQVRLPRVILPLIGAGAEFVYDILRKDSFINRDTCNMASRDLFYSSDLAIHELGYRIGDFRETIRKAAKVCSSNKGLKNFVSHQYE